VRFERVQVLVEQRHHIAGAYCRAAARSPRVDARFAVVVSKSCRPVVRLIITRPIPKPAPDTAVAQFDQPERPRAWMRAGRQRHPHQ
jgi:hypothetical protein